MQIVIYIITYMSDVHVVYYQLLIMIRSGLNANRYLYHNIHVRRSRFMFQIVS